MLEVSNTTPFPAACVPHMDVEGHELLAVTIKGTFKIRTGGDTADPAEEQIPIVHADAYHGEPGLSSLKYESDTCPPKPGADVILVGHAYPKRARDLAVEVGVSLGGLEKKVRVVGDRKWQKTIAGWQPGPPAPFDRIPLVYERAFGGRDETAEDPAARGYEPRNPVGTGFAASESRERLEGLALPNLEDPARPIRNWKDRPDPAGFGFISRDWMPRAALAGTYDERWQSDRCPLLPLDFDPRYFNSGAPGLVSPGPLNGGEPVRVTGAHPSGDLAFCLPQRSLAVTAWLKGQPRRASPALDTVLIEPDEERVVLIWRAAIPCSREFLHIRNVYIKETRS